MDKQTRSSAEEVKYQAQHYNEIPLWSSLRGKAFNIVIFFGGIITLYYLYLQNYGVALGNALIVSFFAYFMLKGKQWSFISLIIVYSADMLFKVYELILAEHIFLIIVPIALWLFVCKSLSNALGVEKHRANL